MLKAIALGILASLFFAFTFVLNREMNLAGGSWIWSASLRFFFMLPMLTGLLLPRRQIRAVFERIAARPLEWLLWSTVGFGFFYASLCFASDFGPSWLIAASWQVTIVAGALLTPLFHRPTGGRERRQRRHGLPARALSFSLLILLGIFLIQTQEARQGSPREALLAAVFVLIAAFSYPLGNRKMMELCEGRLGTLQRVFGMTVSSMPFWILLSVYGLATRGWPSAAQALQTFLVAVFSGIVATLLFFKATDLVHGDMHKLAAVESTQAGEVVFTLLGGVLLFGDRVPTAVGYLGLVIVVAGMGLNSLFHEKTPV
jgi:drug/metabolite transporter (DMT)-like permease